MQMRKIVHFQPLCKKLKSNFLPIAYHPKKATKDHITKLWTGSTSDEYL